jgi:alpha-methylacyl-CoA racemase
MSDTLAGLRIIEIAGLGPGPFAAMMLADHGAEVVRVERPGAPPLFASEHDMTLRNRARILEIDLKSEEGCAKLRELCLKADGLIEGFRPGVMERLGLGPEVLCADNPKLVYGRMTGWGQHGPLAPRAGHDINYIAQAGALFTYGAAGGPPVPPVNAVADFGGGGMMLAFGMLAALVAVRGGGTGRVIDCAMVDGAALLQASVWTLRAMGQWDDARGTNLLDGGAPFYRCYATADARHVAVGAIEPPFWRALLEGLGLAGEPLMDEQSDRECWPAMAARIAEVFAGREMAHWCGVFEGSDACVSPVLTPAEAAGHPHATARAAFAGGPSGRFPAPAPRIARPG